MAYNGTTIPGLLQSRWTPCECCIKYGGRQGGSIRSWTCRSGCGQCGQSGTDTVRSVRLSTRLIGDFASARASSTCEIRRVCLCITIQNTGVLSGPKPEWFSGRVHPPPAAWSAHEASLPLPQEAPVPFRLSTMHPAEDSRLAREPGTT